MVSRPAEALSPRSFLRQSLTILTFSVNHLRRQDLCGTCISETVYRAGNQLAKMQPVEMQPVENQLMKSQRLGSHLSEAQQQRRFLPPQKSEVRE